MKEFIIILIIFCICCCADDTFHSTSKKVVKNEPDFYVYDPIAGHAHKINAKRHYFWPEHKDGNIILKTNNFGFRRDTDTFSNKKGKIRILLTGDSNVSGVINNSESCCAILENLLNQSYIDKSYEVINSAVGYYCPQNYLGIIKKYLYLSPDIYIVIVYGGNDFIETCALSGCQKSQDPDYYAKLKKVSAFIPGGIGQGINQIYYFKCYPESIEISLKEVKNNIHSIKDICESNHIELIVLLLPSKIDIEWFTDEVNVNKVKNLLKLTDADLQINIELLNKMSFWLNNNKINHLNLYDCLKGKDHKLFWNKDYHLNDYGHKIVAETLFATYRDLFSRVGRNRIKSSDHEPLRGRKDLVPGS
jgi:hypothetical protein